MKKAFDANVSRAKPRVRLGALLTAEPSMTSDTVEALAMQVAAEATPVIPSFEAPQSDLGAALRARAFARSNRPTAAEALTSALADAVHAPREPEEAPVAHVVAPVAHVAAPVAHVVAPVAHVATVAHGDPLPDMTEVQTAPVPDQDERDPGERRERLRERLKAVRENPRPEPLPDTVAEAGVLAVERISALQSELTKSRAMNLALAQDLEAARRQSERATEEARMRMDEARRLSKEMEGRVTLLSELERELEALEGERNESLLALQESRQLLEVRETENHELNELVAKKDAEISDSLAEEERLAGELEVAQETMSSLRRSADALKGERDTLARQVSELTRERAELLEARKALEAVHRALSSAAMR